LPTKKQSTTQFIILSSFNTHELCGAFQTPIELLLLSFPIEVRQKQAKVGKYIASIISNDWSNWLVRQQIRGESGTYVAAAVAV
jgi:hypothetical protein